VARAFSTLAPRWQHTLWMTEVEQLPANEVSERLELSANATAALTHRARQAFAEAYLAEHIGTTTEKDCRRIAPHLPGYVRNQLRDLQLSTVERHLVNCQRCAAAVADLRDVNASLRSLLPAAPPVLAGAAAATQATIAATTVGGLTAGLPGAGLLVKGLVAVLLVAPVLSTDSPFSGGGDGGSDARVASASDTGAASGQAADVETTEAATGTVTPIETEAPATETPSTTIELEVDEGGGVAAERPSAVTETTRPPLNVPASVLPSVSPPTLPPVTAPLLPDVVDGVLQPVVDDVLRPIVGGVTEPVVETLDEALAMMGLGSTGETIAMLRSFVPILDGPLLGPVVDELLDLVSIGDGSTSPTGGAAPAPSPDGGLDVLPSPPADDSDGDPSPGANPIGIPPIVLPDGPPLGSLPVDVPPVTVPPVTVPVISIPVISIPLISVPAVSLPAISLPPVSVPPVSVPPISVPPISIPLLNLPVISVPVITLPDLLG
jgi:hypothetical protein